MTEDTDPVDGVVLFTPPHDVIPPAYAENNIPVFFGCDDNFLPHAVVVIASFMKHASPENNYDILIVQWGATREKMARATEWMRQYPNATLRFVDITEAVEAAGRKHFPTTRAYGLAIYFRFFAPSIFLDYDKIAYLDSDIVVFGDVADFYNQDLEGNLIGACHDYVSEHQSKENPQVGQFWREQLGKEPGEHYFFSGGLVMDLAGMRRAGTEGALLTRMKEMQGTQLPDQDVMNSVLNGRVKYIGGEWNHLDWMADPLEESVGFDLISEEAREKLRDDRCKFKVLHYAEKKPWTSHYTGKNDAYYWKYAARTPFYDDIVAKLNAECTLPKLTKRYVVLTLQDWNFRVRSLFSSSRGKAKYASRRRNIELRRQAVVKQMRRMGHFGLGKTPETRLRPKGETVIRIKEEESHGE